MHLSLRTLAVAALSFAPPALAARQYDFQKKVLDNGLTVITLEDHSCPIVAVQVWYHVGSKDEDPLRQGFAHMFEHMMFRGTDVLGPEEHFSLIRRTGGDCNAYTAFDNTTYVNELPANQLELILWLEAQRMAFLRIDDESFFKERAVVEEERRLRSLNTPYGTVLEKLLASLFVKHPYRWSPIGQIPHLRAATIDELQAFWDRFYVPNNATLVIVGDIQHAGAQALAAKMFGWIPKCPAPPRIALREPAQSAARKLSIPEKKGPVPIIGLMYRGVPKGHPDELPLEMLMSILGGGESSRLYRELVKEKQLAQAAVAGAFALEHDGIAGAGAVLLPFGNKKKVMRVIRENILNATSQPVSERELEKVRNQLLRQEVTKSLSIASKASLLGDAEVFEGGADEANHQLAKIRAVTRDDLLRVAGRYLRKENETFVSVEPQFASVLGSLLGAKDDVDEGAAPASRPAENRVAHRGGCRENLKPPAGFPTTAPAAALLAAIPDVKTEEQKLAGGLRVVVVPNHEVPFVTLTLGLRDGAFTEERPGLAAMACNLITKGSAKHDSKQMAEELEFNAIDLGAGASMDSATVSASCVSDKFALAAQLMAEAVRTAVFPLDEFEIARKQTRLGLMVSSRTPEYLADRELRQRLFGKHPYARTTTGELDDVESLKPADVVAWWHTHVRPDNSVLYIAGDVEPRAAFDIAAKCFGDWSATGQPPAAKLPDFPKGGATHIYLVDRPGSVQSQIRVGHRSIRRDEPGYFPGRVLSQILGGGFNSRLNKAIRIERGLTYGASGSLTAQRFCGSFTMSTFTKTPSTAEALRVLLGEVNRIRSSPASESEVSESRSYLVGSFAGQRETPQAIVTDLWLIETCGLPRDYFSRYLDGVRKTSGDDVVQSATQLLHPDELTIVVVGEAEKLKPELEKIAPVTVVQPPKIKDEGKTEESPGDAD
ncbi:MAG: pitrilysin family protein [Phycisphaerae bacterium]